jgi:hypothetical protein
MFIDQINCHVSKLGKYISNLQGVVLHTIMLKLQLKLFNFSFYEVQYWTVIMDHFTFLYLSPNHRCHVDKLQSEHTSYSDYMRLELQDHS